jgi:hypothetical protein
VVLLPISAKWATMAMRLTPPTKNQFYLSICLAVLSIVLYLCNLFGLVTTNSQVMSHVAFWLAVLAWLAMTIGVAFKGI